MLKKTVFNVSPLFGLLFVVLIKDHNTVTLVRLEPAALGLELSTLPLSHCAPFLFGFYEKFFIMEILKLTTITTEASTSNLWR